MEQAWPSPSTKQKSPLFVSLGMTVLDELHFSSRETLYNVPGGSGLYATLGARLMDSTVGAVILTGKGFPETVMDQIKQWDVTLKVKNLPNSPSTRGFLQHKDESGQRTFRYLTPPLQPHPSDLQNSPLIRSRGFHFLVRPELLQEMADSLLSLRSLVGERRPLIVWEPAPLFCKKDLLEQHLQACKLVDVFSPNHLELESLTADGPCDGDLPFSREDVECRARLFLDAGIGLDKDGLVVVRCGEHGCMTLSRKTGVDWLPAFFDSTSPVVVDTTGAGNVFLGAFTVAFLKTDDAREAAIAGSVAASFAIEQIGLPDFSPASSAKETWNGVDVSTRLAEYRVRLSGSEKD
ncbi:Carbohydrate/purine kinase [Cordyceps fumosorosea ARSEF 2679]|uniref:Carbohydrate/purine kinase n=1 Tax=Cordyceps fumosorosea (strain ARSEF 2679) TaxID=1081104 RepID=A0A167WJS0_CORFA|nr:Carbohydrate/purine kinase [Cordyceps fumosorosea ARSEF 2679]OAA63879.1 Carbohydrate/purine kinase [Cordyceps fumosorosea ARSEF 2679]